MSFLLRHLATVHSTTPGFFFTCGLNGCQRTFRNITTYKHHVYAKHSKEHTNLTLSSESEPSNVQADDSESDQSDNEDFEDAGGDSHDSFANLDNEAEQRGML